MVSISGHPAAVHVVLQEAETLTAWSMITFYKT